MPYSESSASTGERRFGWWDLLVLAVVLVGLMPLAKHLLMIIDGFISDLP